MPDLWRKRNPSSTGACSANESRIPGTQRTEFCYLFTQTPAYPKTSSARSCVQSNDLLLLQVPFVSPLMTQDLFFDGLPTSPIFVAYCLGLPYGDQGLFVTADLFHEISGFQPLPIMEDVELIRRLRRKGTLTTLSVPAITSARRWKKHGVLYTTLINQCCIIGYFLGVSTDRIARWYGRKVRSKHEADP